MKKLIPEKYYPVLAAKNFFAANRQAMEAINEYITSIAEQENPLCENFECNWHCEEDYLLAQSGKIMLTQEQRRWFDSMDGVHVLYITLTLNEITYRIENREFIYLRENGTASAKWIYLQENWHLYIIFRSMKQQLAILATLGVNFDK